MLPENIDQVEAEPSKQLLTPDNSVFLFIDQEPQMYFGLGSHDPAAVLNAIVGLAKAAKVWDVPTVYTTVAADSFTGYLPYQLGMGWTLLAASVITAMAAVIFRSISTGDKWAAGLAREA